MARTKQSARTSTAGKAPPKTIPQKVKSKSGLPKRTSPRTLAKEPEIPRGPPDSSPLFEDVMKKFDQMISQSHNPNDGWACSSLDIWADLPAQKKAKFFERVGRELQRRTEESVEYWTAQALQEAAQRASAVNEATEDSDSVAAD